MICRDLASGFPDHRKSGGNLSLDTSGQLHIWHWKVTATTVLPCGNALAIKRRENSWKHQEISLRHLPAPALAGRIGVHVHEIHGASGLNDFSGSAERVLLCCGFGSKSITLPSLYISLQINQITLFVVVVLTSSFHFFFTNKTNKSLYISLKNAPLPLPDLPPGTMQIPAFPHGMD